MSIILAAFLAGPTVLPQIDRRALELQARAEALHAPVHRTASVQQGFSRPSPLDLTSITTICRAAGAQVDPAGFIVRLSAAYSLDRRDSLALRASCAAYLAGNADARTPR